MIGELSGLSFSAKPKSEYSFDTDSGKTSTDSSSAMEQSVAPALRRWESAQTNRMNEHQWTQTSTESINFDLYTDYQTLVSRCRYERMNNPLVDGVCETFAIDVVGRKGPRLIVQTENDAFKDAVETVWKDLWESITVDGQSGTQLLRRLVPQLFDCGDWLFQLVNMEEELPNNTPVVTRLLDLDPIRLWDPMSSTNKDTIMGIERDGFGRPVRYWIRDDVQPGFWGRYSYTYKDIMADDILHCFMAKEPGQVRGFPRLASCLQDLADLREYDIQVLDAAKNMANNGSVIYSTDPTLIDKYQDIGLNPVKLERGMLKVVKPGFQPANLASTQPGAHYIDFRHERLRSLGRCAHMPLLMVLLSAEDSNFSQSRIDLNVIYQRGINSVQQWIEDSFLNPLLKICMREAMLALRPGAVPGEPGAMLIPPAPPKVTYRWGWEPIAQANPKDHLTVQTERIAWGLSSPEIELTAEGHDEEDVLDSIARSNERRVKRGLPPLPGPGGQLVGQENSEEGSNDQTQKKNGNSRAAKSRQNRRRRSTVD